MIPHRISPGELLQLPLRHFTGPIHVIGTETDLESAHQDIRCERVVGLDTETPPAFRKGQSHRPTLVQIATANAVYLFQLRRMDFSKDLRTWLENPRLIKAGVALADDLRKLKELFPFTEQSVVDLGHVARRHGLKQTGVRNLAGIFLGFRITKGPRTSNWRRPVLTPAQTRYAATDAWVCRELYLRFEQLGWCPPNA